VYCTFFSFRFHCDLGNYLLSLRLSASCYVSETKVVYVAWLVFQLFLYTFVSMFSLVYDIAV
jgi:hypothetical protein